MPPNISSASVHRAQYVPFNAAKVVKGIPLANIRNEKQDPFRCGMSSVSDANHRDALGFAMSKAQDVMTGASDLTPAQQACIQKTVGWLNSAGAGGIGNIVLQRLTALGASHTAVVDLLKDTPQDNELRALQAQVTTMIVDLGIAIGDCRTPPQGTSLNSRERAVSKLNDKADLCVKSCVSSIGGQKLMDAIGRAILPQPIMNALVDKRPDLVAKISRDGAEAIDLKEILNAKGLRSIQHSVDVALDAAEPQAAVTAIIQLLKIPAYVVEGDPGKEGAQPNKEKGVSDLPPGLRELAGDGKNVAVNYNDFGKMGNKSTVDGANATRLAEIDVEKHRITIEGMLSAFKLGLEGNRCCGHLIKGVHNLGGSVNTFAHDPLLARTTGSIEIQTDPIDEGQLNGNGVNREIHHGSGNVLNNNEEDLGTLQPQPDNAMDGPDASTYSLAEQDPLVWGDEGFGGTSLFDSSVKVISQDDNTRSLDTETSQAEQRRLSDDPELSLHFDDIEQRLQALRSKGFDDEDVHVRVESETLRQSHPPSANATETAVQQWQPLDPNEKQDQSLANVLEEDARAWNEHTSLLDNDAASIVSSTSSSTASLSSTSSLRLDGGVRMRASSTTPSEDEATAKNAAAKLFKPVNPEQELQIYFDGLSHHPMVRDQVLKAPPRVVQWYEEVLNATGRREFKPVLQDASRFALNFGAHTMPSDLVRFQQENNIPKIEPWRGARHKLTDEKHEYLEFAKVLNAREDARNRGVALKSLNIREELNRINAEAGRDPAPRKTFGEAFDRAATWADAASKSLVPDARDAEVREEVNAPRDTIDQSGQRVQSQSHQMDPVEPKSDVAPLSQPVPPAQDPHAKVRDMLNNILTARVQRDPSLVGLFKDNPARRHEAVAANGAAGDRVAKGVRFDRPLNSRGSSAAPSEAGDDDSIIWDHGTLEDLMDEHSMQLDETPHFVPVPQPLQEKPPIVVGERESMHVFSSGLSREQNLRMMQ